MSSDFIVKNEVTTVLLTEEMVDEFVEKYVPLAIKEMKKSYLRASDYAWERE